jgi:Glycosyl hydrolase family 26
MIVPRRRAGVPWPRCSASPWRRPAFLLSLALLGAMLAVVPYGRPVAGADPLPSRPLARLEPEHGIYFGVNLDWSSDSAAAFSQRLGLQAAVYVQFVNFPFSNEDVRNVEAVINQVSEQGGIAVLTLQPVYGLAAVTPESAEDLAQRLDIYNRTAGVPVIVRFAHEMNGSWYPWSQQPAAYVQAFRTVAAAVHENAPGSAMLWAPNEGSGYPFIDGPYEAKPASPDFALLDTNGDGKVDQRDDMYAPYYPGDDAVDWVGMSLYHWGDVAPWGKNVAPATGKFAGLLTGTYRGVTSTDPPLPNFYRDYVDGHGKPMAVVETAAFYNTTVAGDDEQRIKQLWWKQVFNPQIAQDFPGLKMINWFEWRKYESEVHAVVDWTVTSTPAMARAFVAALPRSQLLFAPDLGLTHGQ